MAQPLSALSNGELWDLWKTALEEWGEIPKSIVLMRRLNGIEDEIIRRIHAARAERIASGVTEEPKLWNR